VPIRTPGGFLISLRKHIEGYRDPVTESAVDAFRTSLLAMAECGQRAIPSLGEDLNRRITEIHGTLARPSAEELSSAARNVKEELTAWAGRAIQHQSESERELKEIISSLARTAESVAARDEKYSTEIGGLSGKLRSIAAMGNLGEIRRSIIESAATLKSCVEKMAQESKQSVSDLTKLVDDYRERLVVSERLSGLDPLTELANRRVFENQLQSRVETGKTFSLIVIDLNGFKQVNDRYGHLAGDDLLRQFAGELRAQFRATDLVARWGGDEFGVLVAGPIAIADERVERVRRWALGEYRIQAGEATVTLILSASVGSAEWNGSESAEELLARADALVYRIKEESRTA
jgi:diguanylate cyclase